MNDVFPSPKHDHGRCIDGAVEAAREAFRRHATPFTPLRERVFREIAASHEAVGAYEILNRLATKGRRLTPISVYRVIDVLLKVGIVRRFKSRNAFYASPGSNPTSPRIVLACQKCARVIDGDGGAVFGAIRRAATISAFKVTNAMIEVFGTCAHCAKSGTLGLAKSVRRSSG
jgi:Fur family zinc uptake transcriptional regulator